jgi:hypothetical protein
MDPTITGALIAGAAALIGFGASTWNTRATVEANQQAALDQRLWEKRSELYEQLMAIIRRPIGELQDLVTVLDDLKAHDAAMALYASHLVSVAAGRYQRALAAEIQGTEGRDIRHEAARFEVSLKADLQYVSRPDTPRPPAIVFRRPMRRAR